NWQGINDQDILQHYSTESFEKNDLQLNRCFYEDHYMNQWEFKTDYKLPLKQNINAEAGIHVNHRFFSADKSTTQLDIASNLWHENLLYSGIHSFSEDMKSAYILMSGNMNKISLQAGLRTQYYTRITDIPEQSLYINFNKLYFFPSLHLSLQGENNSQWQLSYSRRINLPNDWFTSPVPYYNDGFIVQTGNPDLKPELFDVAELNHIRFVKQHMLSLSLYSRITHNAVERITDKDGSGIYIISHKNLSNKYYYGFETGMNFNLSRKMSLGIFANLYAIQAFVNDDNLTYNYNEMSYSSRFNFQYKFLKNSAVELSGFYEGAEREAHGKREPLYSVNFGFRQNLLKNKLNISLSANDIFHTYSYRYSEINGNFKSSLDFRGEFPVVFIGISYRINDFKPSQNTQQNNVPAMGI
ncbi:MAG: outer membrane beta-barrel family protein, partial [Bacteroidales bacterium]|nr:outer membrane beta-barrel family protein [Bacteroidales bacterium]